MTLSESTQWAEMEQAMLLAKFEGDQDADSEDDEAMTDWMLGPVEGADQRQAVRAVCRMPDGDLHLCRSGCKFLVENDDGCMVCEYSGIDYGPKATRSDHCTGRSTWSADPDANACMGGTAGASGGGGWRKRPDQFQASASAYMMAKNFDDSEMPQLSRRHAPAPCKRGARCVDEAPAAAAPKRARSQSATAARLRACARCTTTRQSCLSACSPRGLRSGAPPPAPEGGATAASPPTVDPRLLDQRKLFEAAVRKYVRDVTAKGGLPSMDALHNLAMAVNDVVKQEHMKQQQRQKHELALVDTRAFRATVCDLIVALWHASSKTPYFETAKRGADSFRNFASGVLYALKRGVTTPNGVDRAARARVCGGCSTARAISAGDPSLKSLHAASHKGLCSLHRVIASVSAELADDVFAEPIRVAKKLAALSQS